MLAFLAVICLGCGTTRSTDTSRSAIEQLLISDAIDRAVQKLDVSVLAGYRVYLDDQFIRGVVDNSYLTSTLRQHLLSQGCILEQEHDQADFILEARSGALGTDRHDLLFGIPSMNVPQIIPLQGVPAAIPEVPVAKRADQRGIAKLALFAYHRETGKPVWQSGMTTVSSSSNDVWILGAGPFRSGTIHDGPVFAGERLKKDDTDEQTLATTSVTREAIFAKPDKFFPQETDEPVLADGDGESTTPDAHDANVQQAAFEESP